MSNSTTAPKAAPSTALKPSGRETEFLPRAIRMLRLSLLPRNARAWAQPVTYLGVAMLVFIYCALAYLIVVDRKNAEYDAGTRGDNLARVVDQSFTHIFKSVDNSLSFLGKLYRQPAPTFDLSAWVNDPAIKSDLNFNIMIYDANGRVVDSTFSKEIVGSDHSDQEAFRAHLNSTADTLLIGRSIILKFNGKWGISLSRRLTAADGTFAGVIAAVLDPSKLISDIGQIDLGRDGSTALVGLDSYLRTRSVNGNVDWENIGREVRLIPETLGRAFKQSAGHYWSVPGVFNNVRRMVSYRVLESFPQIAVVTIPEAEVFRRANENARIYWIIAVTLTAVVLIAVSFGARREQKLIETTAAMTQTRDALRQGEERYKLVEAAVNDGIWDWNLLTDEDYLSPRWKSILGFAEDELPNIAASFFDRVHPDDKAVVAEAVQAHLEENTPYDLALRLRHKDGTYRWVHSRGKAIRDAESRPVRMLGTITDITEHKHSEAIIQENHANLARAEAMIGMGHFKFDRVADTYRWSDGLYRILGKSPESFTPTLNNAIEMVHPEDRAIMQGYRQDVLAGIDVPPLTVRVRRDDGSIIHVEVWSAPIRAKDGSITGMFGTTRDVTAREQAEAAIKNSRDNLARAESMVLLGHYKYDQDTDIYTWSEGAYRIYGKPPQSFSPTLANVLQLFHPEDRPALEQYRRDILAGVDVQSTALRVVRDDGSIRHIEIWSEATRAGDGRITGFFGTLQDVTPRKQTQILIEESRDNLARAEAMALLGHTREDLNGPYTWSAGVYRIARRSPKTYIPTPESARQLIHPDDRAAHARYRSDVMAGIDVPRTTIRMVLDDGETIYIELWSVPIRDKDGNMTGKFSALQDVTALRRTEALFNESYTNLERAERLALLGHYKIDRGSGNLVWSEGIYRIFGLSPDTFTPTLRSALELVHPDDRQVLKKARDDAMLGQEIPHVTMRAFRSDGETIDIEYWSTPVRDGNGVISGIFGTVQDVTIRKRAEETLARANQELEARVIERTAELAKEMRRREEAQMTLGQMQKMEAVGQLTAGIAHDFNNLLAVIGGSLEFVDSAAARGLTAEPELIDAALRATRRGRELVRRLLAFSRQSPLRAEATTIDQLVLDTLRLLQRTLGQGIDMVTRLDAKAAVISVDRNQMANALLNLALNARDAMPEGGQLTIATQCRPVSQAAASSARWPMGEEVCIVVSDTGVGMTDDVRSRAFEPFFTTKPDGLGSGLGLSMVQGFVEQSGGTIDIQSSPGKGTTITILLPRVAFESQADEADPVTGMSAGDREKTVLLVEDDPDVRVVTTAQLKQLGYKVHAVANGMEAIDLISSPANIDITLTDIVLPGGLDGVALIKEAMRARPKMGVLCMSGYDPTQKHRKWLQVQNINFLEKPFSSSRLAKALDAALAH